MSANAPYRAGAVGGHHADRVGGRDGSAPSTHALSAGESAWLVALPCALLLAFAVVVLGPPLGHALFAPPAHTDLWSHYFGFRAVRPEPVEHARFVLALLGPLLVAGALLLVVGRTVPSELPRALQLLGQLALVAFVVVCVAYQRSYVYEAAYIGVRGNPRTVYFTLPTLAVALVLAALAAFALHRRPIAERLGSALRETPVRRATAIAVAALVTVAYLLTAFNTDGTINLAQSATWDHIAFWTDEAWAILNGQAPLVDFHAQYGQLWAYAAAGALTLLGASLGVWVGVMLAGTAATMAAVFATLRRLAGGRSLAALALFLPFLATSFYMKLGPPDNRYSPANLFSLFPIRYCGPYVLLWLIVRRVGGGTTRRPLALLTLAGLVVINNPEFGLPALGATLAALVWTAPARTPRMLAELAASALAGLLAAAALVAALTLAVAGSLPHFGLLLTFPRIYGADGFGLLAMPPLGLHLVVYVTFAGAIVLATVRAAAADADRPLTGALVWIGVFGLGTGAYFAGRSHPQVLTDLFSAWSLALCLLTVAVVQAIARRPSRRPLIAELLVLAGFAVTVCSLAQIPTPWSQIDRLRHTQPEPVRVTTAFTETVRVLTHRGEPVALLLKLGHRIAYELDIVDVNPYANIDSMMTRGMWAQMIAALRRAGGRQVIVAQETLFSDHIRWLEHAGYRPYRESRRLGLIDFVAPRRAAR